MLCLENIIKLSRTECECADIPSPNTLADGQTEIYLDELEGLNLSIVSGVADCYNGSIWDMMNRSRENAILAFTSDLMSCIESNYIPKRPNYKGLVGSLANNLTLTVSESIAGQLVKFPRIVGGKAIINRIGVIMNASVPVTVDVYDNDEHQTTPWGSYTITAIANDDAYGVLGTPLELPMWSDNESLLEYYFVYTLSGFLPRNNKKICVPCSGGVKNSMWSNWVDIFGIKGNDTDYPSFTRTEYMMGLILDVEFSCLANRVICSDEYPLDFNTGIAMQMAYAVRFKAGALLLDTILSSNQLNRFTMMDREALYGKRNHYRTKYEEWIQYLCLNVPVLNNDCWTCRPNHLVRRGTILT